MADNHYVFDRNKDAGYRLAIAMEHLENAINRLLAEKGTMVQMLDGDGTAITHFNAHVTAYGFSDTTNAKAAYGELVSLMGKLDVDSSVTNVTAAISQALARFRN